MQTLPEMKLQSERCGFLSLAGSSGRTSFKEHEHSNCHIDTTKAASLAVSVKLSGGSIKNCLSEQISLQQQAA